MTRQQLLSVAKPILFNTDMARAILDGRKTVTMRVCKFVMKPGQNQNFSGYSVGEYCTGNISSGAVLYSRRGDMGWTQVSERTKTKYLPDDILYVRERFREFSGMTYCWQGGAYIPAYDFSGVEYFADGEMLRTDSGNWGEMFLPHEDIKQDIYYGKWHPSIHMPKEAARIFSRVTDVRCERLQDVTLSQIEKEGLYCDHPYTKDHWAYSGGMFKHWIKLWDSTIKTADLDRYGWDANPWVWVYEFERVMPDA